MPAEPETADESTPHPTAVPAAHGALARRVRLPGAIGIGLASMIGAGVFAVWGPATDAARGGLIIALVLAALIATLNAFSSAQLAMAHPVAGGAYAFGRRYVGPWTGFSAGWLFVTGKTASAAAIASIAAAYLYPTEPTPVAVGLIVLFAALNMAGVRTTARVAMVIVATVLTGLAVVLIATVSGGAATDLEPVTSILAPASPYGVLQGAALLFFAFAGYARMATLGEEVVEPRRTLPRAIFIALGVVLALYATVAVLLISTLGTDRLAGSSTPFADALDPAWAPLVVVVAGIACLGSLVGILAGLSRTSLAMARGGDLPGFLARIWPRTSAPAVAEAIIASIAIVIVVLLDPAQLVAASSSAVLLYYAVAHVSALRQPATERWQPRVVAIAGLVGCVVLVAALPPVSILGTAVLLAIGLVLRMLAVRRRPAPDSGTVAS
ncbi:amino acid/polyamine/organocation transporter (APC superfamily) [Microcella putealis]|uniref:Amino acid/polyamine/organocation transporter (APC superfamily) n=1 Tax=Microcella putealis TaxID=337005 RepID=A0A4Q7M0T9_9MICO|nr:APC family permease [Microcella putealis]RZS59609.1 amino acid/polyamine/organocation transporter (APC superfamily) [Microcella putealis]TQM26722.1 amino acid/polyamine/organocation transporter (APC superfamily) [Microcella putealis]